MKLGSKYGLEFSVLFGILGTKLFNWRCKTRDTTITFKPKSALFFQLPTADNYILSCNSAPESFTLNCKAFFSFEKLTWRFLYKMSFSVPQLYFSHDSMKVLYIDWNFQTLPGEKTLPRRVSTHRWPGPHIWEFTKVHFC